MELRKDYFLDRWVIISEGRAARPKEFEAIKAKKDAGLCFFCPGNEALTPPEIGKIGDDKSWSMRWFTNKFPAVSKDVNPKLIEDGIFSHAGSYGQHEVIVETNDHNKQLAALSVDEFVQLLKIYSERITALSKDKNTKYVIVFKNHGQMAGTSLVHSHTQLASINILPPEIKNEIKQSTKAKRCLYCDVLEKERNSPRLVFDSVECIAFTPYASRFNYELWIFPKRHVKALSEFSDAEYYKTAELLKKALVKLTQIGADYNFILHYAPKHKDFHFHIEVLPRISTWAGFEFNSGIIINSVSPEKAAEFYRS